MLSGQSHQNDNEADLPQKVRLILQTKLDNEKYYPENEGYTMYG